MTQLGSLAPSTTIGLDWHHILNAIVTATAAQTEPHRVGCQAAAAANLAGTGPEDHG